MRFSTVGNTALRRRALTAWVVVGVAFTAALAGQSNVGYPIRIASPRGETGRSRWGKRGLLSLSGGSQAGFGITCLTTGGMEMGQLQGGTALVVGASQGIGHAFVAQLATDPRWERIYGTYRQEAAAEALARLGAQVQPWALDATDEGQVAALVAAIGQRSDRLDLVINCVGVLHQGAIQPEKSLRQISADQLLHYFQVNTIPTALLLKHGLPLLKASPHSVFAVLSAKIGSIGDNQLGGWYGYRASKAALNMVIKTAAIEYARKSPQTILLALHPGTTDTRLSQPFQRQVPPGKLFSPDRTVRQLLSVIADRTPADSGGFFSWDGSPLPW